MRLISKTTNKTLVPNLEVANGIWPRMKGLLGRSELPATEALLIKGCDSIHTFFMRFAIDVVFVDSKMIVKKTVARVKPGRLVYGHWGAAHVIEFSEGFLENNPIQIGEQLHVDSTLS